MTYEEIDFFETRLREMLVFVSNAKISAEQEDKKIIDLRSQFKLVKGGNQEEEKTAEKQHSIINEKEILKECMFNLNDCTVRKTKGGFEVRFRRMGIEKSRFAKTKKEAQAKMQRFLTALNKSLKKHNGELVIEEAEQPPASFLEIADYFIYHIKQKMVAPETYRSYKQRYEHYIRNKYKNCTFAELTPMKLQPYLEKLRDQKGRTYEEVRMLLNGIFKYARANGLIDINPIEALFILPHERTHGKALTLAEEKDLLERIKGTEHEYEFLVCLYAGARPSEATSDVIDIAAGTITLKNAKLKKWQKQNKERVLPLFPMLKKHLDKGIKKRKAIGYRALSDLFSKIMPTHTLKDLRHTFATRCKECGVLPEVVNLWQGHVLGSDMTALVYTHYSLEFQKMQAKLIEYDV